MTGWLNFTRRPSATNRADRSVIPAGGAGTIIRIGREGKDCAEAEAASSTQKARASSARMVSRKTVHFGRKSRPTFLFTNCSVYALANAIDGLTAPARTILS